MGIFKKLFGLKPKDPTETFPRRLVPPQLVWDHTARTLCGIPLPSPVEALVPLGPADGFKALNEHYWTLTYSDLGIEVEVNRGQMQMFTLHLSELPEGKPKPGLRFARPVFEPGRLAVDPTTPLGELRKSLGECETLVEDEDEKIYLFRSGHVCLEVTFTPDDRLVWIEVYNDKE